MGQGCLRYLCRNRRIKTNDSQSQEQTLSIIGSDLFIVLNVSHGMWAFLDGKKSQSRVSKWKIIWLKNVWHLSLPPRYNFWGAYFTPLDPDPAAYSNDERRRDYARREINEMPRGAKGHDERERKKPSMTKWNANWQLSLSLALCVYITPISWPSLFRCKKKIQLFNSLPSLSRWVYVLGLFWRTMSESPSRSNGSLKAACHRPSVTQSKAKASSPSFRIVQTQYRVRLWLWQRKGSRRRGKWPQPMLMARKVDTFRSTYGIVMSIRSR